MRKVVLALIASVIGSAAFAADMPVRKAPAAVQPQQQQQLLDWSGLYAGIQFGAAFGHWRAGEVSIHGYPTGFSPGEFNASGAVLGAHIGWNWHLAPSIVVGFEADFQKARAENTRTVLAIIDVHSQLESYATARARVGFTHGIFMLYATGGYAWGRTSTDVSLLGLVNASANASRHGWTYGGGIEMQLTPNWYVGLQYKHIDLGSENLTFAFGRTAATVPSEFNIDEITVRASYRF